MNKLKDFTKKYGFYLAVGAVSIGAIVAVVLTTEEGTGIVNPESQEVTSQEVSGSNEEVDVIGQLTTDDAEEAIATEEEASDAIVVNEEMTGTKEVEHEEESLEVESLEVEEVSSEIIEEDEVTSEVTEEVTEVVVDVLEEEPVVSETFSTTTIETEEVPYFAEGDMLEWPVEGDVIVPFRDDTTKHWFSTALDQTMRTYGICISAVEGDTIKAPAKAILVDVVADSTTLESTKLVGNVGEVAILDLGNDYTITLGLQGGTINKDLIGQVVEVGQEIGTVGNGTGPFADLSHNIYMQAQRKDEMIDPTTLLSYQEQVAEVEDTNTETEETLEVDEVAEVSEVVEVTIKKK